MSITIDDLPNEVRLGVIIIRILPGKGDFETVTLVNRRLRDVVETYKCNIVPGIASYQFRVAARVASLHPVEHLTSLELLRHLSANTRDVDEFMHDAQELGNSAPRTLGQSHGTLFRRKK
jgi:hypothetical protein